MNLRSLAGCFLIISAIGCQSEKSIPKIAETAAGEPGSPATTKLVDVTLALNWYPEAEHGGYYAALVHGYFKNEGLNVTIRPGGPGVPVIQDAATGTIDFAIDNADKLLLLLAQQADVVALMSPIQDSPRCIMVHKKSGLNRLEDIAKLKSFTLAINQGQPFAQYMIKKLKLDDVRVVPFPSGVAGFMDDENYGQQAYSFSEPFLAEEKGGDPQCLMLSDIGFNTYTSVLITSRDKLNSQPDLVAKVTRASIQGWKKYLAEPDDTNKYIHEQNSQMGLEILLYGAKALKASCLPEGFAEDRLGEMSAERWQTLVSQMVEIDSIKPESVKADNAFTLQYLGKQ